MTYIITERDFDVELLKRVLPPDVLQNVKIVSGGSYSSALSLASSLLSSPDKYVVLVLNAESNDDIQVLDRYYFLRDYMRMGAADERFRIFLFKPEIEHIFFEEKSIVEEITGRKLSDLELELAELQPRMGLSKLSGMSARELSNGALLNRLSEKIILKLREAEEILRLTKDIKVVLNK